MSQFSFSVVERGRNVINLLGTAVETVLRLGTTGVGIGYTACSLLTLGKVPQCNTYAFSFTSQAKWILPGLYVGAMKVVNPKFSLSDDSPSWSGVTHTIVAVEILNLARELASSPRFISKEIASRVAFLKYGATSIITRIADLALGVLAVVASLCTLGCIPKINRFASEQLTVFGIIPDVCTALRYTLNPHQLSPPLRK